MYTATGFYFVCYIPELYANYKNKNANCYNVPEKILLFIGSLLALSYAVQLGDISIITNYGLAVGIDIIALSMRIYYSYHNNRQIILPVSTEILSLENVNEAQISSSVDFTVTSKDDLGFLCLTAPKTLQNTMYYL